MQRHVDILAQDASEEISIRAIFAKKLVAVTIKEIVAPKDIAREDMCDAEMGIPGRNEFVCLVELNDLAKDVAFEGARQRLWRSGDWEARRRG